MSDLNTTVASAFRVAVQDWTCADLAALNLEMGFGTVSGNSRIHSLAMDAGLVKGSGQPVAREELLAALSVEINDRIDRGEWR